MGLGLITFGFHPDIPLMESELRILLHMLRFDPFGFLLRDHRMRSPSLNLQNTQTAQSSWEQGTSNKFRGKAAGIHYCPFRSSSVNGACPDGTRDSGTGTSWTEIFKSVSS
jgi:hypothetical protein